MVFQTSTSMFHVNLQGCRSLQLYSSFLEFPLFEVNSKHIKGVIFVAPISNGLFVGKQSGCDVIQVDVNIIYILKQALNKKPPSCLLIPSMSPQISSTNTFTCINPEVSLKLSTHSHSQQTHYMFRWQDDFIPPSNSKLFYSTAPKTNMTMETQLLENASPTKNGAFPVSCSFSGV